VYADYRKIYSNQDFDLTTEYGRFTIDYNTFEGLKTFFSDRYTLIKNSLEEVPFSCDGPGTHAGKTEQLPVNVYPCPSDGWLNIEPELSIEGLQIFDIYGRKVKHMDHPDFPINLNHLEAGTYLLFVSSPGEVYYSKFILQ